TNVPGDPEVAGLVLGVRTLGSVADHHQRGRHGVPDPGEDPDHVLDPLHLPEIGDVGDDLVPFGSHGGASIAIAGPILVQIDEVGNDLQVAAHAAEGAVGLVSQVGRYGGDRVGALDRELGDGV